MKTNIIIFIVLSTAFLLGSGCAKETVDPNLTGSIEGVVRNSGTGEPIMNASITTSPGTDALLTNQEGQFLFEDIATGDYTVKVEKDSFATKTVRLSVKENQVTNAQIQLKKNDKEASVVSNIRAEATFFENFNYKGLRDSVYVHVEYRFENISRNTRVGNYEVYFKIYTPGSIFHKAVSGDSLAAGEQSSGTFEKFIYQYEADSVAVSGVYAQNKSR